MFRIALDVDEVLRDFFGSIIEHINDKYGTMFTLADINDWDFDKTLIQPILPNFDLWKELKETPAILSNAGILWNGINLLHKIRNEFKEDVRIILLTSQKPCLREALLKWTIENDLSKFIDGILFQRTKEKWKENFDLLIDDALDSIEPTLFGENPRPCILWAKSTNLNYLIRNPKFLDEEIKGNFIRTDNPFTTLLFIKLHKNS